jgi:hypothetical protein
MRPGKESFTSALIWSLTALVKRGDFSTQELLRTIQNEAPNFPKDQFPKLSERQPSSYRKIMLSPLHEETDGETNKDYKADECDDDFNDEMEEDLLLRFVFNESITESMIRQIADHMRRLIHEGDIKANTVLWEGIKVPKSALDYKLTIVAQPALNYFSRSLSRIRIRKQAGILTAEALPSEPANIVVGEAVREVISTGPSSSEETFIVTPDPSRRHERNIGEDQETSADKPLLLNSSSYNTVPVSGLNSRGMVGHKPNIPKEVPLNREREIDFDHDNSSATRKRAKIDRN